MPRAKKFSDKLIADVQMDIRYKNMAYKAVAKKYKISPSQVNYINSRCKTLMPLAKYVPIEDKKVDYVYVPIRDKKVVEAKVNLKPVANLKKVVTGNAVTQAKKPLSFFDWLYKWFGSK